VNTTTVILSPCIGICEMGSNGLCTGCLRTNDEIAGWMSYSPAQREYLMQFLLPQREDSNSSV